MNNIDEVKAAFCKFKTIDQLVFLEERGIPRDGDALKDTGPVFRQKMLKAMLRHCGALHERDKIRSKRWYNRVWTWVKGAVF